MEKENRNQINFNLVIISGGLGVSTVHVVKRKKSITTKAYGAV